MHMHYPLAETCAHALYTGRNMCACIICWQEHMHMHDLLAETCAHALFAGRNMCTHIVY